MLVDVYKLNPKQALYVPSGEQIPPIPEGIDYYMLSKGPIKSSIEIKPQLLLPKGEYYIGLQPDDICAQISRQGFAIQECRVVGQMTATRLS